MILQALAAYYEQLQKLNKVAPAGWCFAKVSYALVIDDEGSLINVISLKGIEQRGKKTVEVPQNLLVPQMVTRSSGISSNFLCDNSKYLLGIDSDGCKERYIDCFNAAREKHEAILKGDSSPIAIALLKFFAKWNPENYSSNSELMNSFEDITSGGNLIFEYRDRYVQDYEEIKSVWNAQVNQKVDTAEEICLVTGEKAAIARLHYPIKNIPGAQSSGASLVSFNADAFDSYGKKQGANAPVSEYAVNAYTTALNYLLAERGIDGNRKFSCQIGDTMVVYWSENANKAAQSIFSMSINPTKDNQETLRSIFSSIGKGSSIRIDDQEQQIDWNQKFYILGLSPNAARISIRFFYVNTLGSILENLKKHYDRMELSGYSKDNNYYMGVWQMLQETVNQKSRDKNPKSNLSGEVFRAIISGARYPEALRQGVMLRIRAEQDNKDSHTYKITKGRISILKADLLRNRGYGKKGDEFVGLDENCKEIGYVFGREFAVLEQIQHAVNPDLNTTIKDQYMNSASTTPSRIFPVLLRKANSHLRKIKYKKDREKYENYLTSIQNLLSPDTVVTNLSAEQQELFFLGYYHQKLVPVISYSENKAENVE